MTTTMFTSMINQLVCRQKTGEGGGETYTNRYKKGIHSTTTTHEHQSLKSSVFNGMDKISEL